MSEQAGAERMDEELRALGLRYLRGALDSLDGADELGDPDLGEGHCDDCSDWAEQLRHEPPPPVALRWTLGVFQLCRDCRRRRFFATEPDQRSIVVDEHWRPDDLWMWATVAARHRDLRAIEAQLVAWEVEPELRKGLLREAAKSARRGEATTTKTHEEAS